MHSDILWLLVSSSYIQSEDQTLLSKGIMLLKPVRLRVAIKLYRLMTASDPFGRLRPQIIDGIQLSFVKYRCYTKLTRVRSLNNVNLPHKRLYHFTTSIGHSWEC